MASTKARSSRARRLRSLHLTRDDTAFMREHRNLPCVRAFLELVDADDGSEDPGTLAALHAAVEEVRAVRGGIEDEGCGCIPWRIVPSRARDVNA